MLPQRGAEKQLKQIFTFEKLVEFGGLLLMKL